jgi:hypothetical protein
MISIFIRVPPCQQLTNQKKEKEPEHTAFLKEKALPEDVQLSKEGAQKEERN